MKSNWWPTMEMGRVTAPRDWYHWPRKARVTQAQVSMFTTCPGTAVSSSSEYMLMRNPTFPKCISQLLTLMSNGCNVSGQ